jgi:hypothetical protein
MIFDVGRGLRSNDRPYNLGDWIIELALLE